MWPVSDAFLTALSSNSPTFVVRVEVLRGGSVITENMAILRGAVTVDSSAAVWRRCSVTVVDQDGTLTPSDASDPLSPYGYELRLWRGLALPDGTEELVPLGIFRIASVRVVDAGTRTIDVTGYDRSRMVARARFTSPYTIAAGSNYVSSLQDLIASRMQGVEFVSIAKPSVTPLLVFEQMGDPWGAAQKMATSIGSEVFFDPLGRCVIRAEPDPVGPPVYFYEEGENATVISINNELSDEPGGFNGVIVDGEPAEAPPVRAVAWDEDPESPTYHLGPYGKVPMFLRSTFIANQQQADDAAAAELRRNRGGTEQLVLTAIPNPAHEAGDIVQVKRNDLGVDSTYLITSLSIPLEVSSLMSIATKRRRTV